MSTSDSLCTDLWPQPEGRAGHYRCLHPILCVQIFGRSLKEELDTTDIHIHFPAGAVGKDGPSAGVTVITVLMSLFSDVCVRSDTAMTGEITLRGLVLPVS